MAMVATGTTEEEMAEAVAATRAQIGFYASTPAYRPVLEMHGWGDLQPELRRLSKAGEWGAMGDASTTRWSARSRWSPSPTASFPRWPSGSARWPTGWGLGPARGYAR